VREGAAAALPAPDASAPGTHSVLEQFGDDLTEKARQGKLVELVGRVEEVQTLIEVLCRTTKRNPVLVGPPGVGKTAIAEGLAIRISRGDVPALLQGFRVVAVHPALLAAGVGQQSELQERVKLLIEEAIAGRVVLFIDEVHALVGMGGDAGANDLATLFKPALSRGEIAVVAATTDAEYRRFIQGDGALERRFQPIRIQELSKPATLELLKARRDGLAHSRGVAVGDDVLSWIIDFTDSYLRSRFFPDKAIDLLEQCVAFAASQNQSALTLEQARSVGERMVGMPAGIEERIGELRDTLQDRGLLSAADTSALIGNLHVRMRGFGVNPERPDGVILLLDEAASAGELLGETIAESLYGSVDRLVVLDFGRLSDPQSLPLLLGAPPSYIGFDQTAPIHALLQAPWSVVLVQSVQAAHPLVISVLEQALDNGYFTDGAGRRVYLSDAVVIMTAGACVAPREGFPEPETTYDDAHDAKPRACAEDIFGASLVSLCDVVASGLPKRGVGVLSWFESGLLASLAERFAKCGLDVTWHPSLYAWLAKENGETMGRNDWERLLDEKVASVLMDQIPPAGQRVALTVGYGPTGVAVAPTAPVALASAVATTTPTDAPAGAVLPATEGAR
jgi:ATP-dependent Clp protease ATP-binding subunit ClpC